MNTVTLAVQREYDCDVLVAGGGVAGLAAAVAAARQGARVILSETGGVLGGTATKGLVGPFMTCYDKKGETQIIRGFFAEFVERMIAEGGAISYNDCHGNDSRSGYRPYGHIGVTPFAPEVLKRVADEMCLEAGVRVLYHTQVIGCDTIDGKITRAYIAAPSGVEAITAKSFIDATGTAALAACAGAQVTRGNEDGTMQTTSMFFTIGGVDKEMLDDYMATHTEMRARFFMDELEAGQKSGEYPCGCQKLRIFEGLDGVWFVNMSQEDGPVNELDAVAVSDAEMAQRQKIPQIIAFLRKTIPALRNIELLQTASDLGVRESRRIVGKTVLTGEDILNSRYYDERIAVCANSIDIHMKDKVFYVPYEQTNNYYIPLSCLISNNITNLFAVGKCLSADQYAFAAVRVIPPCFAMGEAAGVAAALSLSHDANAHVVDVRDVQKILLDNGGYLE